MAGFSPDTGEFAPFETVPGTETAALSNNFAADITRATAAPTRAAPESTSRTSYLDFAVRAVLDPLAKWTTSNDHVSDEVVGYARGFLKTLPLFMRGRLALSGLLLSYMADEAKLEDSLHDQLTDAGLGISKGGVLKSAFGAFGRYGATPGMIGMGLGVTTRFSDTALTRRNYYDSEGRFCLTRGLRTAASVGLNPGAIAVDVVTLGAADVLWARLFNWSRGAIWYNPVVSHSIAGGTMGMTTAFGYELHRQLAANENIDIGRLARTSMLHGTLDAIAGGIGGYQSLRHMRLRSPRDGPNALEKARSTPFQRGELVDRHQAALRDGEFIFEQRVPGLTTETVVGWTRTPEGIYVRSVFRPSNGSESFAQRMQSEIAAYGLQSLGFNSRVPVTVARRIELNGQSRWGYIQEMEGVSFADYVRQSLAGSGKKVNRSNLIDFIRTNGSIRESYTDAWLHRLIMGEWDNHALNMTVRRQAPGGPEVRNIDFGDGLRRAETQLDLTPTPGVRQGYDRINAYLYGELAGQRLSPERLASLKELQSRYSTADGIRQLQTIGLTTRQAEGLLGRLGWLIERGRMPRGQEAAFYLPLNDARRAVERWLGKGGGQPANDPTIYYVRKPPSASGQ